MTHFPHGAWIDIYTNTRVCLFDPNGAMLIVTHIQKKTRKRKYFKIKKTLFLNPLTHLNDRHFAKHSK